MILYQGQESLDCRYDLLCYIFTLVYLLLGSKVTVKCSTLTVKFHTFPIVVKILLSLYHPRKTQRSFFTNEVKLYPSFYNYLLWLVLDLQFLTYPQYNRLFVLVLQDLHRYNLRFHTSSLSWNPVRLTSGRQEWQTDGEVQSLLLLSYRNKSFLK